jgi:hypothetical protein
MDMSISCPWSSLPHIPASFCEQSVCGWIRQPANTWSNLGFIVVGVIVLLRTRRDHTGHLRGIGYIAIATGLGSAFFHASETFFGVLFDYVGMFLAASYMLAVNVRRLTMWNRVSIAVLFWTSFIIPISLMFISTEVARPYFMIQMSTCCIGIELILRFRHGHRVNYKWLVVNWFVFSIGFAFWILDSDHKLCDPTNHFMNGHAAWHLLNAVSIYALYEYYRQFGALRYGCAQGSPQ